MEKDHKSMINGERYRNYWIFDDFDEDEYA
jgi:hypothetical protein